MPRISLLALMLAVAGIGLAAALAIIIIQNGDSGMSNENGQQPTSPDLALVLANPVNGSVFAGWCDNQPSVTHIDGVDTYALGTHPDLVDHFWDRGKANAAEGVDPRRVICGRPGLVNPDTGVIYGLATGTSGFFLRLPDGSNDKAALYGPGWSSVEAFGNGEAALCRAAYEYAG